MRRPSIAIVGAGRFGTALALSLNRAGYEITDIVSGSKKASRHAARKLARIVGAKPSQALETDPDLIWFCIPDDQIAKVARTFAHGHQRAKFAFHSSGVLTSDVLEPLRRCGTNVASVHPLMTFVKGSVPCLSGVTFAIEGDASAVKAAFAIMSDLNGIPTRIRKADKLAYHAFATMVCPLLVSLLASAERVADAAGMNRKQARRRALPIIEQTLRNYAQFGPEKVFTGPFIRGDADTVRRHLEALATIPAARHVYVALAKAALEYLPSGNRRKLEELLGGVKSTPQPRIYTDSRASKT